MRVAHFLHHLNPYGTERVVHALLKYRSAAFNDQVVVSQKDGDFADEMRATGCEVRVEPEVKGLVRHLSTADVINCHALYQHTFDDMMDVLRRVRKPYLFTVHWPTRFAPELSPVYVCTSLSAYRAQDPQSRCEVVENGIDLEPYETVRRTSPADEFVITRICRPAKSDEYFWYAMADILSRYPQVRVRIVGSPHQVEGRVESVGVQHDTAQYLADSDLFVYTPRPGEGTKDLVIMEAMAMGVPCVLPDVEVTRRSAVQGKTALMVPFGNTEALVAAIATLIEDPALRARLGQASREHALRHFDARHRAPRYERVYDRVLKGAYRMAAPRRTGWAPNWLRPATTY